MRYILSFHIISMVAWFAGLFYLPRLFVYHTEVTDENSYERFLTMERRLFKAIMNPAMIATIFFGFWLETFNWSYYFHSYWMHAKGILVAILIIYHHLCGYYIKKFHQRKNEKSQLYFRFFNEVPTVILIAVTILVVVKPF